MQEQQILKAEIVSAINSLSSDNLRLLAEFTVFLKEKSEKKSVAYSQRTESGKSRTDTDDAEKLTAYTHLKMKILEEYPEMKHRTPLEIHETFDRISRKAAKNMPYKTADEFIKAMRREDRL